MHSHNTRENKKFEGGARADKITGVAKITKHWYLIKEIKELWAVKQNNLSTAKYQLPDLK
jgi:hypothetical protein